VQSDFRVEVHPTGRNVVLQLFGELDVASSPRLEAEIERAHDSELTVVDLRALEFIDSTGLGVLVRAHHRARELGHGFALVKGLGQVDRLLAITGIADQLLVAESAEELLSGQ
jgi:anti-sigma B factor antagonist